MILKIDGVCYLLSLTELSGNDDEVSLAEITHVGECITLRNIYIYIYTHTHAKPCCGGYPEENPLPSDCSFYERSKRENDGVTIWLACLNKKGLLF